MNKPLPEVWLRGPVEAVSPLLQPVAHSLLQCREEISSTITGLTADQIWTTPSGAASIGFHVRHAAGSLDRLFTFHARRAALSEQRAALAAEGEPDMTPNVGASLLTAFHDAVERALAQLRNTDESSLVEARSVGRAQLPTTVIGLLFHAAEHTQRHAGQAVTTARVVRQA